MENGFITFGYPKKPWRPPRSRLVQRFPQWPKSAAIPGVAATGPANPHFIRDIGCAYLVTALALLWFAAAPEQARPAVLFGGSSCFYMLSCTSGTPSPDVRVPIVSWPKYPLSFFQHSLSFGWGGRQGLLRERVVK